MSEQQILAFCNHFPLGCWSIAHRCFLGRCEQTILLATRVLGSRVRAEHWLYKPAIGLRYQLPCCILATTSGFEVVGTLLERIEQGIYP
ncbi:antitoxin Xre/MbcA/ParS toxin-binding domain-containing protein [Pseudomonas putida]|uniref:antitoxin Xre/MbcA/ParS toxin-binding domain-containing protein n=1 Tax=Pseudomonas putida TaxID=303 RepID=UPI004046BBD6